MKKIRDWAHAIFFETFAAFASLTLRCIPIQYSIRGNGQPILLVHGYLYSSSIWFLFKKRLEALGFGPIYTIDLTPPFSPLAAYAKQLEKKAEQIQKETKKKELILIGHSMGGLVCALYATEFAPPNTITDIITIASPFFGTSMADMGIGKNAKEMCLGSPTLREIREKIAESKGIRFFHIATKTDLVVIPSSSEIYPNHRSHCFRDLGHMSLLFSKKVVDQVASWLS